MIATTNLTGERIQSLVSERQQILLDFAFAVNPIFDILIDVDPKRRSGLTSWTIS